MALAASARAAAFPRNPVPPVNTTLVPGEQRGSGTGLLLEPDELLFHPLANGDSPQNDSKR
jgi:hypothetical protein